MYGIYNNIKIEKYRNVEAWKFFDNRTLDNFLTKFKIIFPILKDIDTTIKIEGDFEGFWSKCRAYLEKVGHNNIDAIMSVDSDFARSSRNHWTKMFDQQPEGLEFMYKAFKATFGITGNDDYCQVSYGDGFNYSWKKMSKLVEVDEEEVKEVVIEKRNPEDYKWSEKTRDLLKKAREKLNKED